MDFSLIICTFNRADCLKQLLQEVNNQSLKSSLNWEVIIADNNSQDNTKEVANEFVKNNPERFIYLFEPKQGKSFALNSAIDRSSGAILIFSDDDIQPDKNWLQSFIDCFNEYDCAGVGGRILPKFETVPDWYSSLVPFPYRFDFGKELKAITSPPFGANMAYRREMFEKYGKFNEDLGPTSDNPGGLGEDSEFGKQLLDRGEVVIYSPDSLVYHPVNQQQAKKEFLYDWSYRYGQSIIKRSRIIEKNKIIFGVPRYYITRYLISYLKLFFLFDKVKRIRNKCLLNQIRGQMKAFREVSKGQKSA